MNYFPSKNFFIALGILAFGGGVWWLISSRAESPKPFGALVFENNAATAQALSNTNGDGTKLKQIPLVFGQNDTVSGGSSVQGDTSGDAALTQTQLFTRDFLNTYVKLKQSNQFTPDNQKKLVDAFVGQALSREATTTTHTIDELTIIDAPSVVAVGRYAQGIITAMQKNFTYSFFGDEMTLLQKIVSKKDSRSVSVFGEAETAYRNFAQTLLKMSVPRDVAESHLSLVNSAFTIAKDFSDVQKISTDPVQALPGVEQYPTELQTFGSHLREISSYLSVVQNTGQ